MTTATHVYKILRPAEWQAFDAAGVFTGSPVDLADGFIHLSTADQVIETASRHFTGETDLVLVTLALDSLESQGIPIKWEVSRGGALFPHAYAGLPRSAVKAAAPLPFDATIGRHSPIEPLLP